MKGVRPIEWAVLAFLSFVLVRAGPGVFLEFRQLAGLRTVSVFFALAVVGTVLLAREFRALPPLASPRHRMMLAPALMPLLVVGGLVFSSPEFATELSRARAAQVIPMLATVVLRVGGLGLPTLVLWLLVGLELKRQGRVDPRAFVKGRLRELGATLRDWSPLLFILSAYAWMDAVGGGARVDDFDPVMAAADRRLFAGHDPLELLQPFITRPASEWLAFAYSFYAVLFPLVLGVVSTRGPAALREASFALGAALLIAYVSYTLVPVKGPLLSRSFDVSLELYLLASVKESMMDATRITYDCFPSMHTCCTVLLGWSARRHAPRLFWWLVPVLASIPIACVYLRYHYVVDVLAGLALASFMMLLTPRLNHSPSTATQSAGLPPSVPPGHDSLK